MKKRPRTILDSDVIVNPKSSKILKIDESISSSIFFFYRLETFRNIFPCKIFIQNRPRFFFFIPEQTSDTSYLVDCNLNCKNYFSPKKIVKIRNLDIFVNCHWKGNCFLQQLQRQINHWHARMEIIDWLANSPPKIDQYVLHFWIIDPMESSVWWTCERQSSHHIMSHHRFQFLANLKSWRRRYGKMVKNSQITDLFLKSACTGTAGRGKRTSSILAFQVTWESAINIEHSVHIRNESSV